MCSRTGKRHKQATLGEQVDQAETLLRQLDAELAALELGDRNLVSRLRELVAAAVNEHDLTAGSGSDTVPAAVGAAVVLSVLDAISSQVEVPDKDAAAVQELVDLHAELRNLRSDPTNVENLSSRALLWRTIRGKKG